MDAPVASLKLVEVAPSGTRTPIHVEIGCPRPDRRGSWACAIRVAGLDSKPRDIYGEDSLQALCLGLRFVRTHLEGVLERGNRLVVADDGSAFPLEAYFEELSNGITRKKQSGRYAAKLLFQFRVMVEGSPDVRRTCEERIITFSATHGQAALREAKRRGRAAQHRYKNNQGNPVHFEFVGVLELLRLDPACEADEVWYELKERVRPMERRASIIPPENQLSVIRNHD
ncbi:MAG: DUF4288 domain-containing protein [Verrucomicrobia subdivision 3 bacterium]|nr:DUF4288 domain-containing protein [Limisphaerales bacterium]